jgi:hypothetical protein
LKAWPGEKRTVLRAAILIVAPVCGLRPVLAFLLDFFQVPKPTNCTELPFFREVLTSLMKVFNTLLTADFGSFVFVEIESIKYFFLMLIHLPVCNDKEL